MVSKGAIIPDIPMGKPLSEDQISHIKESLSKFREDPSYKRPRSNPMARLFGDISDFLDGYDDADEKIDFLYTKIENDDPIVHPAPLTDAEERLDVIRALLKYLVQIHELSVPHKESKFISIPVYDMKLVEKLLNIIVIEGVYASLPRGVGISLEKRRLKNFKIPLLIHKVQYHHGIPILSAIVDTFCVIFRDESDLRDLIQVGTGFTDAVTSAIVLIVDPMVTPERKQYYILQFRKLEASSSTYQLFALYTLLMASTNRSCKRSQYAALFRQFVLQRLSLLIVEKKKHGVEALIDVVMGLRNNEQIDMSRIEQVVRVIVTSKPKSLRYKDYFENICDQLYDILVHVNRPVMTTIACSVVESLFNKNKNVVRDFFCKNIWDIFNPRPQQDDEIVLVSGVELNNAINVLVSVSRTSSLSQFLHMLFGPITMSLWGYLIYQKRMKKKYSIPAGIISSILALEQETDEYSILTELTRHLYWLHGPQWDFAEGENGLTEMKVILVDDPDPVKMKDIKSLSYLDVVDLSISTYMDLLDVISDEDPQKLVRAFSTAFRNWFKLDDSNKQLLSEDENPFASLVNAKLVEMMLSKFKDKLASSPDGLLKLSISLLTTKNSSKVIKNRAVDIVIDRDSDDEDSDDEGTSDDDNLDPAEISLEILSNVLAGISNSKNFTAETIVDLKKLDRVLDRGKDSKPSDNLHWQIKGILDEYSSKRFDDSLKKQEANRILDKAMKSINNPAPSVRAYGMQLVRMLASDKYNRVSTNFAINLHLDQLKDKEPYIYLNAIKGLEALLEMDVEDIFPQYMDIYTGNSKRKFNLDERLRIGEVVLRFSQKSINTIPDNQLGNVVQPLINLVSTRSHKELVDDRLRMSALSILGAICHETRVTDRLKRYMADIIDLILGVLTFEGSKEKAIVRRSAIVAINDLVTARNGLKLIGRYGPKLESTLKYVAENDNDVLVRDQANGVLYNTDEAFEDLFDDSLSLHK